MPLPFDIVSLLSARSVLQNRKAQATYGYKLDNSGMEEMCPSLMINRA